MKKLLTALGITAGVAFAAPASAIVVGGINFGTLGETAHIETATLAETFANGIGQTLEGYGVVSSVNSNFNYCAVGTCFLYYHFYDYTVSYFDGTGVQFTGGVVDIYFSNGPALNMFDQTSPDNIATITAMDEWVRLLGHTFADASFSTLFPLANATQTLNGTGFLTGETLSQAGQGLLDVDLTGAFGLASVASYFDGNSIGDGLGGFADIALDSSSSNEVLNPEDVLAGLTAGCDTGLAEPGAWCLQGTLDTRGSTNLVPEPASLALVGLGLLGVGMVRRRRPAAGKVTANQ